MDPAPNPTAARPGPGPGKPCKSALHGALVTLLAIILVAAACLSFLVWRFRRLGPPADCSAYSGGLQAICSRADSSCSALAGRDAAACRAAVGACMPAVGRGMAGYPPGTPPVQVFNDLAPHARACVEAAAKVSPQGAAAAALRLGGPGAGWSQDTYDFFHDPQARENVRDFARLVPFGADWGLAFGENVPVKHPPAGP